MGDHYRPAIHASFLSAKGWVQPMWTACSRLTRPRPWLARCHHIACPDRQECMRQWWQVIQRCTEHNSLAYYESYWPCRCWRCMPVLWLHNQPTCLWPRQDLKDLLTIYVYYVDISGIYNLIRDSEQRGCISCAEYFATVAILKVSNQAANASFMLSYTWGYKKLGEMWSEVSQYIPSLVHHEHSECLTLSM